MRLIPVTTGHITMGKPYRPSSCPIALALRAAGYKEAKADCCEVHGVTYCDANDTVSEDDGLVSCDTSRQLSGVMMEFDKTRGMRPFTIVQDGMMFLTLDEYISVLRP